MEISIELAKILKPKPADDTLQFGRIFTDHMFIMDYDDGKGWHDPRILPYGAIPFDPASMVFHYGQAVFEGMKTYLTDEGDALLFRPRQNFERMNRSNSRMIIPQLDIDFAIKALKTLIDIEKEWIPKSSGTSLYIRPFVISTEAALGVHASSSYKFIIILSPVGAYYKTGLNPVRIFVEDEYVRAVRGGIGFTKASANYAISLAGQIRAEELGYSQVLWLDGIERKYVEEVGTMNVFFKIGDELVTPQLGDSVLPGITRRSVIELAESWGLTVVERKLPILEVFEAAESGRLVEAFGSGTAAVISPIGELNWAGRIIELSEGKIGELSQKLYDTLTGIQYGKLPDPFGWTEKI